MMWKHELREISRREALRLGLVGAAGLFLGGGFAGAQATQPSTRPSTRPATRPARILRPGEARAKSVIQIWCWGGPPHIDTFDPKPDAGRDYCGPLDQPAATNVDGIRISQLMPMLATQADKYSLIRSMTHGSNGHETAAYMTQTGRQPGDNIVHPSVGAVVSYFKGYNAGYKLLIPPYVVLTESQGRFDESGFLGARYKPLATGGDPSRERFEVEGIVARGITEQRQKDRRVLLGNLNTLEHAMPDDSRLALSAQCEKEAYELILGDARKVFDLSLESAEMRDRYGRNKLGQSCLLARRLVEEGIPYVTVNSGGWDTHSQNFEAMRRKLPEMDRAIAALIGDLSERGLLDSTIIWWGGEFGRTPKVDWQAPWNGGRGHWGNVFCSLVAGGGFKGGHVVGSSDEKGMYVKDRPVYPPDLIGSMYELLGIDPKATLPHPQSKIIHATATPEDGVKMAGRLKEIM